MDHKLRLCTTTAIAVLLHAAAVVVAKQWPIEPAPIAASPFVEVDFSSAQVEAPAPPPDDVEDPPPPPPPEIEPPHDSMFRDETPTPPPQPRRTDKARPPLVRPPTAAPPGNRSPGGRVHALLSPRPEYPYEARRQRLTGSGVALFTIDPATGAVLNVRMLRSTGSPVLDNATLTAFRRWRFRPGSPATVQAPITYTLAGAVF